MKYDLDALAQKMGVADSQRRFPQTGLKMMWELELLDFQKTGRITGQNHSALGRIMRINNAVLSKFKGIGQGLYSVPQARPRLYHGWAIPLVICGRISLCRIKLRSCCMTGFRRSELNADKNLYVPLDFKLPTGSLHTFSKTICKQYYLLFSRMPGMLYLSSISLSSPVQIRWVKVREKLHVTGQLGNKVVITYIL